MNSLILLACTLLPCEIAARSGLVSPLLFPVPSVILGWLWTELWDGELLAQMAASGWRLAGGVGLGAGLGLVVGLAMGAVPRLRVVLDPVIAAIHPLPKVALLPLFLVLFGFGETARLLPVALVAFFPMAIAAATAIRAIDPLLWDVARNYGAGPWMTLRRIMLPGARPVLLTGLRLSLNVAIVVMISVEMLSGTDGLGATIWQAWQTMRIEQLYGTLVVIAASGILLNRVLAIWTP